MQERAAHSRDPDHDTRARQDSLSPLEILEKPAADPPGALHGNDLHGLSSAPIDPSWVIEGSPAARNKVLAGSSDGLSSTILWDCTAGRFNWYYGYDETVYVIEGSVTITLAAGSRRLKAGDIAHFPSGSHAVWNVEKYIRKVAFCHDPLSRRLRLMRRLGEHLRRLLGH
jgi:uncharacterized cupin superfamily protein